MNNNTSKRFLIYLVLFSMLLVIIPTTVIAGGDIVVIDDTTNLDSNYGGSRIVIDSNGYYYAIMRDESEAINHEYEIHRSTDEGVTWNELIDFTKGNDNYRGLDMVIDSNDRIHIFYGEYFGSATIKYRYYDIDSATLSGKTDLDSDAGGDVFPSFDATVDYNDNIYVAWSNTDDNEIALLKYTYQLSQWGSEQEVVSDTDNFIGIALDSDASGDVYISTIKQDAVNGNDLMLYRWDNSESDFDNEKIRDLTINADEDYTDIGIDQNGVIHIVYQYNVTDGDLQVNYTYGNFGGVWYDEQIYFADTYDQINPSIAISNDDVVHIVWDGNNADLGGRDGAVGKRGYYGNWSDLIFYAWDGADSIMYSNVFYQNFPSNLNSATGIIGVCDNSSEHQLLFFDYGIILSDDYDTEYDICENSDFRIEYLDGNTMYTNESYRMRAIKTGWSLAKGRIMNTDTDTTVVTFHGGQIIYKTFI